MAEALSWLPFLLQTSDPTFPTGAYAHSYGLEGAVQLGHVQQPGDLGHFLKREVEAALLGLELPYLRFAHEANGLAELLELDDEFDASVFSAEARQASRQLGQRRLAVLAKLYDAPAFQAYADAVQAQQSPGHQVIAAGVQARLGQVPLEAALTAHAYQTYALVLQAAMKLIRIGQEGCQRLLTARLVALPELVRASLAIPREDAGASLASLDIASARHATAFARLFIS